MLDTQIVNNFAACIYYRPFYHLPKHQINKKSSALPRIPLVVAYGRTWCPVLKYRVRSVASMPVAIIQTFDQNSADPTRYIRRGILEWKSDYLGKGQIQNGILSTYAIFLPKQELMPAIMRFLCQKIGQIRKSLAYDFMRTSWFSKPAWIAAFLPGVGRHSRNYGGALVHIPQNTQSTVCLLWCPDLHPRPNEYVLMLRATPIMSHAPPMTQSPNIKPTKKYAAFEYTLWPPYLRIRDFASQLMNMDDHV